MEKQMFSKKATKKKVEAEETEEVVSEKEMEALQLLMDSASRDKSDNRLIALFGDIDEPKAGQLCYNLHILSSEVSIAPEDPEDLTKGVVATVDPIQLMICSPGGNASEMFAIYDNMRLIREACDIETFGVGKVMSAGVLLLAAGTKGKRTIGKNCRVMIHSVIGGVHGGFHNVENEMDEIRWVQSQYIKMLASETDMSQAQLKKMLQRKVNIYLSAEEAVELGIADIIV
jgi:ATP-dependent Clp endopeptidase proteolytic subunit ClpP